MHDASDAQDPIWQHMQQLLGEEFINRLTADKLGSFQRLIANAASTGRDIHDPGRTLMPLLGDRWNVLLLILLNYGPLRFSVLQRMIDVIVTEGGSISRRMLSFSLRALEREGFVARRVITISPPNVEYALTDLGRELIDRLLPLVDWARANTAGIKAARQAFDNREAKQVD